MTTIHTLCSTAGYFLAKQTIQEKTLVGRKFTFALIYHINNLQSYE